MELLDVIPLSLGLEEVDTETGEGTMNVMLPRNTKVPAKMMKHFTTIHNYQKRIKFIVLQGEEVAADDCTELAKVTLENLPMLP